MANFLLLAQSVQSARSLEFCLQPVRFASNRVVDSLETLWNEPVVSSNVLDAFDSIANKVEASYLANREIPTKRRVFIIVDTVHMPSLNLVKEDGGWETLIALLIVVFPEIHWIFCVFKGGVKERSWDNNSFNSHSLLHLYTNYDKSVLFDSTGLRQMVRDQTNIALTATAANLQLPKRRKLCAVIDDEPVYSYLHAYIAYRFGFRCEVIDSWRKMKRCFADGSAIGSHDYFLIMEDMNLNFPDKPMAVHLQSLQSGRAQNCPLLDSLQRKSEVSRYRVLITSGDSEGQGNVVQENKDYLKAKAHGSGRLIYKPVAGMFDLWDRVGLYRKEYLPQRRGNAPGFEWPPFHKKN